MTEDGFTLFLANLQQLKEPKPTRRSGQEHVSHPQEQIAHEGQPKASRAFPLACQTFVSHRSNAVDEDYTGAFCLVHQVSQQYLKHQEVLLSVEDYDFVASESWHVAVVSSGRKYCVMRSGGGILSRLLMGEPEGKVVDHKNRNEMDNRRDNLRICTSQQNNINSCRQKGGSSQYRGVYLEKGR